MPLIDNLQLFLFLYKIIQRLEGAHVVFRGGCVCLCVMSLLPHKCKFSTSLNQANEAKMWGFMAHQTGLSWLENRFRVHCYFRHVNNAAIYIKI